MTKNKNKKSSEAAKQEAFKLSDGICYCKTPDFEELGRENEMFAKLAEICKANNNVWCEEAEKYLLNTMASNSCNGEGNRV